MGFVQLKSHFSAKVRVNPNRLRWCAPNYSFMNYKNKLLTRAKGPGRELSAYILAVNMWPEAI